MQWALAMLNSSRITASCQASANVADLSFRQRYLNTDAATGKITTAHANPDDGVWPSCVFDGTAWACDCPTVAAPVLAPPVGTGPFPAFRVRFVQLGYLPPPAVVLAPTQPAVVRIEVNGCNQIDNLCLNFRPAEENICNGTVCAWLSLSSGLKTPPLATITARGNVDVGGAALAAYNAMPDSSGITIQAGGVVNRTSLVLHGPPGTPTGRTVVDSDPGLSDAAFGPTRMFASIFGVWRNTYWQQPGAVTVVCMPDCSAATVRATAALNPGRVILVQGNLVLEGGGDIGSVAEPALLVVSGNVSFTAPTNVFGFMYSEATNWASAGTGQIQGAIVAEGNLGGTGSPTVVYGKQILENLRWRTGSFVRVPGSWRDFP